MPSRSTPSSRDYVYPLPDLLHRASIHVGKQVAAEAQRLADLVFIEVIISDVTQMGHDVRGVQPSDGTGKCQSAIRNHRIRQDCLGFQ
jgi:hypothetical protein